VSPNVRPDILRNLIINIRSKYVKNVIKAVNFVKIKKITVHDAVLAITYLETPAVGTAHQI
jgi:hypothetical protein